MYARGLNEGDGMGRSVDAWGGGWWHGEEGGGMGRRGWHGVEGGGTGRSAMSDGMG